MPGRQLSKYSLDTRVAQDLMGQGAVTVFDIWHFGFALLNGLLYFILGILIIRWAENKARREGRLSGY